MFYAFLVAIFIVDGGLMTIKLQDKMELDICQEIVGDLQEHEEEIPYILPSGAQIDIPTINLFCIPTTEVQHDS